MVDLSKIIACVECGSTKIKHRMGSIVCRSCGAIFSELTPEIQKRFEDASDVI